MPVFSSIRRIVLGSVLTGRCLWARGYPGPGKKLVGGFGSGQECIAVVPGIDVTVGGCHVSSTSPRWVLPGRLFGQGCS